MGEETDRSGKPGVNQEKMIGAVQGDFADVFALFTGGNLSQSTIFGLGIMPYISASIIFQLLVTVIPALEKESPFSFAVQRSTMESSPTVIPPDPLSDAMQSRTMLSSPATIPEVGP